MTTIEKSEWIVNRVAENSESGGDDMKSDYKNWMPTPPSTRRFASGTRRPRASENTAFQQGDATHLDFPDGTFDAVVSNYVYHNIPGDRQQYLMETLRTLKKGGTFALHDIFSKSKYGDMQAFVRKLRDMGYQKVELIDTTNGEFMTRFEAGWMALSGSALLTGIK